MEHLIFIREAITDSEIARFFEKLHSYHRRDIFPEIEQTEDLAYFLSDEYLSQLKTLHRRQENRLHFLFFERGGQDIGFTMPVVYGAEDDKCFIMEFCVYPEFRGSSTGHACGEALLSWARERRASYFELNCDTAPRERFWGRLGFLPNGCDEWNIPLMLRPPEEYAPITVRQFVPGADDWQLWKLENGYLAEIGETPLDERKQAQLLQAIQEERITFFAAYRKTRMVGMCSVSRYFRHSHVRTSVSLRISSSNRCSESKAPRGSSRLRRRNTVGQITLPVLPLPVLCATRECTARWASPKSLARPLSTSADSKIKKGSVWENPNRAFLCTYLTP